ncbi:hypothetical protein LA6_002024 [Marinibacterium anthonyi]|nr:hypothetical protein LA6_002024 [Marinibacterium anthonyi]
MVPVPFSFWLHPGVMSLSFRIFPNRGLVFVQYEGFLRIEDTLRVFGEYMQHPHCRPGQKQLVDLAGITGFERDFANLIAIQAKKVDVFSAGGVETLMVYHAPGPIERDLSRIILRSWEPFDGVIPLIQDNEADALALLGQPERSFRDLLIHAGKV